MRNAIVGALGLALIIAAPVTTRAQERVPYGGSQAVGFDLGVFLPTSDTGDQLDIAPPVAGLYEYYVNPRVSLRGSTGWARPAVTGSPIDKVGLVPLLFDVNYNWEGGKWHPFVGAGAGAYFLQYMRRGEPLGDSVAKPGVNAGGGLEYFFNRTVALKGEGRYHSVAKSNRVDASGGTLTVGLKTYF